jgi:hypothetical protein
MNEHGGNVKKPLWGDMYYEGQGWGAKTTALETEGAGRDQCTNMSLAHTETLHDEWENMTKLHDEWEHMTKLHDEWPLMTKLHDEWESEGKTAWFQRQAGGA